MRKHVHSIFKFSRQKAVACSEYPILGTSLLAPGIQSGSLRESQVPSSELNSQDRIST